MFRLRVYGIASTYGNPIIYDGSIDANLLRRYSSKIYNEFQRQSINNAKTVTIVVGQPINGTIMRLLLDHISDEPRPKTETNTEGLDIDFETFFELCFALWNYHCRVKHWKLVADHIRVMYWGSGRGRINSELLPKWMFIGLVFDWPEMFERASEMLLVKTPALGALIEDVENARYLPEQLSGKLLSTRRQYVLDTHQEIINICGRIAVDSRLRRLSLLDDITTELLLPPAEMDLNTELPEGYHERICPRKLLDQVIKAIRLHSPPSQPQLVEPLAEETNRNSIITPSIQSNQPVSQQRAMRRRYSPIRKSAPLNQAADIAPDIWRWGTTKVKVAFRGRNTNNVPTQHAVQHQRPQPTPITPMEVENICANYISSIRNFRHTRLRGLDINNFKDLQDQHAFSIPSDSRPIPHRDSS